MLDNKKAFQISINMIVVMIIGLAMLGVGISIFYKTYNQTVDIKEDVDAQTQRQLNDLLDTGEAIVVPFNSREVERGNYVDFDIGISNELGDTRLFYLYIRFDSYVGRGDYDFENTLRVKDNLDTVSCRYNPGSNSQNCADKWILLYRDYDSKDVGKDNDRFLLENNDRYSVPVRIVLPRKISYNGKLIGLPAGQYVFNVDVFVTDSNNIRTNPKINKPLIFPQYFSKKKLYVKVL